MQQTNNNAAQGRAMGGCNTANAASSGAAATTPAASTQRKAAAAEGRPAADGANAAANNGGRATFATPRTPNPQELFFGHKACAGCGGSLAVRAALKVLGPHAICALPAGCMSAVGFNFPQLCFGNNAIITPFAATAAVASGIAAGLKAQGKMPDDCTVLGIAGDGGTADIGLQALSGAIDRNDDILYICYDNEAYMNTGIQRSSLTPFGARTTTTPVGSAARGCATQKKSVFEMVAAQGINYAATASVGYIKDFMDKVARAASLPGTKYIHVMAPCPTGWGCGVDTTVELARQVVDCGLWYLAEFEGPAVSGTPGGRLTISKRPKAPDTVEQYLRAQGRFKALTAQDVQEITAARDAKWQMLEALTSLN